MAISSETLINRKLLDNKFQGYRLDSCPLPLFSKEIEDIDIARPSDDQFSFLQQREFSLHNHLHHDPWNLSAIYIINSSKQIVKFSLENNVSLGLSGPFVVWQVPFMKPHDNRQSNVTCCFASVDLAVVSNGAGKIYIIFTGDRKQLGESWKELYCESVSEGMKLIDALTRTSRDLHCLCCHVDTKHSYITHLNFLRDDHGSWKLVRSACLSGKGSVDFAAFSGHCKKAVIVGQIDAKTQEYIEEEKNKPQEDSREILYEWQQNFDEIKVWVRVPDGDNTSVSVSSTDLHIKSAHGNSILQGKFFRPIEDGLSIWQFIERDEKRVLEVVLSKKDEGSMWTKLFDSSDFGGREIPDADLALEIHNKLAHLTSETEDVGGATVLNSGQLEECDISDGEGRSLIYYDLTSSVTCPISKTDLGNGQWLMTSPRTEKHPPRFCLRSDVDGIVYEADDETPLHVATLCAFGFVQASKTMRVFSFLPPDLSYCGLVDSDGRVFIYQGGVRPAKSKKDWGTQNIVSLEKKKIFGVHATGQHLFILSEKHLHLIQFSTSNGNCLN